MTQRIDDFFGLKVSIKREIDPSIFSNMSALLTQELSRQGRTVPHDARVYIMHLELECSEIHFTVPGIAQRVAQVDVLAATTPSAREGGRIMLVDLGCNADPAVPVERKKHALHYVLSGEYVANNSQHCEHVAAIVKQGCNERHKVLQVKISARATPTYAPRLQNLKNGQAITKLQFYFTRAVQLTLEL